MNLSTIYDSNQDSRFRFISQTLLITLAILLSFQASEWFTLSADRVHVISLTASTIAAFLLNFRKLAFPGVVTGLLTHYLFISQRDVAVSFAFSLALPAVMWFFTELYLRLKERIEEGQLTLMAMAYISVMVVVYPIFNTLMMTAIAWLFDYPLMTELSYYGYAVLSGSMTQLVLTPVISVALAFFSVSKRSQLLTLNRSMFEHSAQSKLYLYWGIMVSTVLFAAIGAGHHVTSIAFSLLLVPMIGLGLGQFGFVLPALFTVVIVLVNIHKTIVAYESGLISDQMFYGLIVVLFALSVMIFLMITQAIKNFLTTKAAIDAERHEPYTGLYTIAQLKEDVRQSDVDSVLVLVDLSEVTRRVKALGLAEKSELLKQLSHYLNIQNSHCGQGYIAPFTTTLLYKWPKSDALETQLTTLHQQLQAFSFDWNNRAIKVLDPQVRYTNITQDVEFEALVSQLCSRTGEHEVFSAVAEVQLACNPQSSLTRLSQVQQAFDNDAFELYCQPYRHLQNTQQTALSFEVLLRLPSEGGEVLSPAQFFPLINEFGLQFELDKWVIRNTFQVLNRYVSDWQLIDRCCINLTAQALTQPDLANSIVEQAQTHTIPLTKICFEITESMPLANESNVLENISQLRNVGCKIALDDFGTGYASFDYLRRIPLDILKIDGSFVEQIDRNENDRAIVANISQIAQNMGLITVAEFVESEQHADILRELNVVYAQGFGVAKPRPLIGELQSRFA